MIDFTSPNTVILINLLGIGFLGVLSAFGQWYGKRKENAVTANSKDVAVPSVAIADRVALENMADTLRDANRVASRHREHDVEMLYELRMMNATLGRIEGMMGRMMERRQRSR